MVKITDDGPFHGDDHWAQVNASGFAEINAAIDEAAAPAPLVYEPHPILPESPARHDTSVLDEPSGYVQLPPPQEETLLNLLPVSLVDWDDAGRLVIAPHSDMLQEWDRGDREAATFVTSWLNTCGAVQPAIERAIKWGTGLLEEVSQEYDERLAATGFDHGDASVRECDSFHQHVHETVEHAKDVLEDVRIWQPLPELRDTESLHAGEGGLFPSGTHAAYGAWRDHL